MSRSSSSSVRFSTAGDPPPAAVAAAVLLLHQTTVTTTTQRVPPHHHLDANHKDDPIAMIPATIPAAAPATLDASVPLPRSSSRTGTTRPRTKATVCTAAAASTGVVRSNNYEGGGDLVVTAVGTSRFRIVGFRSRDEEEDYTRSLRQQQQQSNNGVRHFRVEELRDEPLSLPNFLRNQSSVRGGNDAAAWPFQYHQQTLQNLSVVSPIPALVLRSVWPWRLMVSIRETMKETPALQELERFLPPNGNQDDYTLIAKIERR